MKSVTQKISSIGRNIRTMARQGQMERIEAAKRIKFYEQSVALGLDYLEEEYEREPSVQLLESLGDFYVNDGAQIAAKAVFKAMFYEQQNIHVTNMIYAALPATRALIDHDKKLLYIPIPKCGSTTVKNYFTSGLFNKTYDETVHFKHPEIYQTITPDMMRTTYKDYYKFSVVRDPMSRLVSYYMRNVFNGSLTREAFQQTEFMGAPTRPGPLQFAQHFHQYRQFFKDFRHHTDPICGYLDPFRSQLDKIYQMSELPDLRKQMSDIYGREITDDRSMVSKEDKERKALCEQAVKRLQSWYQKDYDSYF